MNNLPNNKTKLISEVAEKFSSLKFSRILIKDTLKKSCRCNLEDRINYLTELNIRMSQLGFSLTETAKFFYKIK